MAELSDRHRLLIHDLQLVVSVYTRAFVSQSVGIIGLLWCLFDNHPALGPALTLLVLADQAVFLKGRFGADNRGFPYQAALNAWSLAVSLVDVLLLFAILFRGTGLRQPGTDAVVTDPLDCLAFSIATLFRSGSDLVPASSGGRLLASLGSGMGTLLLISGTLAALHLILRRSIPPRARR